MTIPKETELSEAYITSLYTSLPKQESLKLIVPLNEVEQVKSWLTLAGLCFTQQETQITVTHTPFEQGMKSMLKRKQKQNTTSNSARVTMDISDYPITLIDAPSPTDISTQKINAEDDLVDEEDLIDDADWIKPILPGKIAKKKACKDCSCGLKEVEENEVKVKVGLSDVVGVVSALKSNCGSVRLLI